ncbi:hypothetical protein NPIL_136571 [Nephila pilipes]|uniref:Uncharacterized protein n=1 Tax=Nephila pilipes TaxID=299642 RepID=A0A8X6TR79_NEPPI|nr:hypothetical protein NPIL_136571 [Nephila pilipes]
MLEGDPAEIPLTAHGWYFGWGHGRSPLGNDTILSGGNRARKDVFGLTAQQRSNTSNGVQREDQPNHSRRTQQQATRRQRSRGNRTPAERRGARSQKQQDDEQQGSNSESE